MPNWCNNHIEIKGKREDILEFFDDLYHASIAVIQLKNHQISLKQEKGEHDSVIHGNIVDVSKLDKFTGENLGNFSHYDLFQLALPMPSDLYGTNGLSGEGNSDLELKYGASDWYDWCVKNWGTKWGCCNMEIANFTFSEINNQSYALMVYDTAWAPGDECLSDHLFSKYPKLEFFIRYSETGMGFEGYAYGREGKLVASNCYEINEIPEDIDEAYERNSQ